LDGTSSGKGNETEKLNVEHSLGIVARKEIGWKRLSMNLDKRKLTFPENKIYQPMIWEVTN
jgi:hypothetical protein